MKIIRYRLNYVPLAKKAWLEEHEEGTICKQDDVAVLMQAFLDQTARYRALKDLVQEHAPQILDTYLTYKEGVGDYYGEKAKL
jgi:phenolic acid decarboxylase